jgi:hypothetical protein
MALRFPLTSVDQMAVLQERGALLTGLGVGAGLVYWLDPERGRRRRASAAPEEGPER